MPIGQLGALALGLGVVPFGWDIAAGVILSAVSPYLAVRCRLSGGQAARHSGEHADEAEG